MKDESVPTKKKLLTPSRFMPLAVWEALGTGLLNIFVYAFVILFLFPVVFMVFTAFKETEQLQDQKSPIYPARQITYTYQDETYKVYHVPFEDQVRQLALIKPSRQSSVFVDPQDPAHTPIEWEGNWRGLEGVYEFYLSLESFKSVFEVVDVPRMMRNTFSIALISEFGVIISSLIVAYGFARYPIPGGDFLFYVLIATILIPEKITLIPTYYLFTKILNWDETWLPILIPFFFGNAVYIFLMRQNIRSIPKEVDEAAMLDGAGPLRTLFQVILPQTWPVVITASLLHFFFIWNETRKAALYLGTRRDLAPISFGIQNYQGRAPWQNNLQASALIIMVVPVLMLIIAQRYFMRDMVVTGLEK